jgi:cyclase
VPLPPASRTMLGGGNTLLYMGSREALVTDGKNFGLGRTLAREARTFGVPVTRFVNTHHHGDHTGGNEAFADAVRLAHVNAAPRILETAAANIARAETSLASLRSRLVDSGAPSEMSDDLEAMARDLDRLAPEDFGPTETFDERYEIDLDGHPVLVRWVSRGHTDGDAFLHLPEENVLHCGDLLFHGRHPYVDVSSAATPQGWLRCIDAMLALCDDETVVVPGHGTLTDRTGLQAQGDYFRQLEELVGGALSEGRSRAEVERMGTPELRGLSGAEQHLGRNLGIVYDEMAA